MIDKKQKSVVWSEKDYFWYFFYNSFVELGRLCDEAREVKE